MGSAAAVAYCCAVASAPFMGAYLVGNAVDGDKRYAKRSVMITPSSLVSGELTLRNNRTLSFRDCLPGSPLEDYSGALRLRMRNP